MRERVICLWRWHRNILVQDREGRVKARGRVNRGSSEGVGNFSYATLHLCPLDRNQHTRRNPTLCTKYCINLHWTALNFNYTTEDSETDPSVCADIMFLCLCAAEKPHVLGSFLFSEHLQGFSFNLSQTFTSSQRRPDSVQNFPVTVSN